MMADPRLFICLFRYLLSEKLPKKKFFFLVPALWLVREGNGSPLQYSCLENPWTEEHGRLQSMGSLRVRHDWATALSLFTFMHWRRKWQPTPVFLPGESQGRGSLVGAVYGVAQSRTQLNRLSSSSTTVACGMLVPDLELNLCHPAVEAWSS